MYMCSVSLAHSACTSVIICLSDQLTRVWKIAQSSLREHYHHAVGTADSISHRLRLKDAKHSLAVLKMYVLVKVAGY